MKNKTAIQDDAGSEKGQTYDVPFGESRKDRSLFKLACHRDDYLYRIENKDDAATIFLYDEISFWGIDASTFISDLNKINAATIHLRINSPGGSVFDGTAIHNAIRNHKAKVIAHIDGLCASIASVIAMAADEIRMAENAFMMIHEAWSWVQGNADAMRSEADLLDKVGNSIAKMYADKSGKSNADVLALMKAETWFNADEAVANGFATAIDKEKSTKAHACFDLSIFNNVPDCLNSSDIDMPTIRECERALQAIGIPNSKAKGILAKGFESVLKREADADLNADTSDLSQREVANSNAPCVDVPPEASQTYDHREDDILYRASAGTYDLLLRIQSISQTTQEV